MGARVAVAGASGYAGGELLRLLAGHPDLELGPLAAQGNAGTAVTAVHPQLTGHPGLQRTTFVPTDPELLADADLLFTALPHGESAQLAAALPAQLKVIDLGADFRLDDPQAWARYYPTPYAGHWTYGLPRTARRPRRDHGFGHGGRARLLRHGLDPRPGPAAGRGSGRAGRHRDRRRLGHLGRRPRAPARPARQRGDGLDVGLPGRRDAPAHPGNRANPLSRTSDWFPRPTP